MPHLSPPRGSLPHFLSMTGGVALPAHFLACAERRR